MVLQYEGTRYNGWQKQGNTTNTIQGKIEEILSKLTEESVEIHGSGRTDVGVHARGQVANVHLKKEWKEERLRKKLNQFLPEDIRILQVEKVDQRFHSRLNAVKKQYNYYIETGEKRDVFSRRTVYDYGRALNIDAMKEAAEQLIGTHDYKSFCGNRKMKKSTVRTIESINIEERGSVLVIEVVGDGFLQNMVRILVGTLIEVGEGIRKPNSMSEILESKERKNAGETAPAKGLCLEMVVY